MVTPFLLQILIMFLNICINNSGTCRIENPSNKPMYPPILPINECTSIALECFWKHLRSYLLFSAVYFYLNYESMFVIIARLFQCIPCLSNFFESVEWEIDAKPKLSHTSICNFLLSIFQMCYANIFHRFAWFFVLFCLYNCKLEQRV